MKITNIKTTLLYKPFKTAIANASRVIPGRDIILIEIETDEGLTGVGFLTGMGVAYNSEAGLVKDNIDRALKPMLIGCDPFAREHLWRKIFRATTRFGRKGATIRALSGIDIALWDLAGKAAGLPVYKMIGYDKADIPAYASGGYYGGSGENDVEALAEEVQSYTAKGYKAIKIKVGRKEVKEDIRRITQIRRLVGNDIELMVDANEAWNVNDAIRFCEGVKDLDLYWVEEPLEPDDLTNHKVLADKTCIPIASGESEFTKYGFWGLIKNGVRIIQPDATRVGGISEWLKVAALGQCLNLPCVPHAVQELHVTCVACASNSPFTEYFLPEHPMQEFISELFVQSTEAMKMKNGKISPLDVPGLGLGYDPEVAKHYTVEN